MAKKKVFVMNAKAIEAACGAALDAAVTRAAEDEAPAATVSIQPADALARQSPRESKIRTHNRS